MSANDPLRTLALLAGVVQGVRCVGRSISAPIVQARRWGVTERGIIEFELARGRGEIVQFGSIYLNF